MIIKELNLIGFGKFKNKRVHLKEGINIIYGENEDGKTTIHNFINGMFYGFLKPYVKRTIYLDEYNRYEPWDNSRYSGTIKFSYEGEVYRIQREFTRNNESTQVVIDSTGEDITASIDNGSSGRILQPGNHFFGFNHGVYSNTISIKQLENKTEDILANELRDKLINMNTSLDDELSVEKAIDNLEKTLKDIGTMRATKSLYGSIYEALNKDKIERNIILKHREEYEETLEENARLEAAFNLKDKEIEGLKINLEITQAFHKNQMYIEAMDLERDIKQVNNMINTYEKYKDLDDDDYLKSININNKIENLNEKIREYEEKLEKILEKRTNITSDIILNSREQDEVDDKFTEYEKLETEKEELSNKNETNHLEFLKKDFENNKKVKDKHQSTLGITGLVLLISIVASIFLDNFLFVAINFISIPLGIFSLSKFQKSREMVNKIKLQILEGEKKEENIKKALEDIEKKQKKILNSLALSSKLELKDLRNKIQIEKYRQEDKGNNLEILNKEIIDHEKDILFLKNERLKHEKDLQEILGKNSFYSIKDLEEGLKYKKIYEDSLISLDNKKQILNKVLNENSLEDLKTYIESYESQFLMTVDYRDIEDIKKDIEINRQEISNINIEKTRIEEKLNYLNTKLSKLVEVEENIGRQEDELSKLDDKRAAVELAMQTIKRLSKEIHREFAPRINETVGNIIENISDGKYTNVKVNDKLELTIMDSDTGNSIDINSLSGGTIDQLYFSLRFAIIDSFNRKNLPLILDDCFIQYDNIRLENMMRFLINTSKDRQIILFTCHERELSILNKLKIDFNLVDLT